ncbi:hypothetical protein Agub_g6804, partial [Astrephomene gubernaculifera]
MSLSICEAGVGSGTAIPTPAYEARSLALSATCISWSPAFCTAITSAAATAAAAAATTSGQDHPPPAEVLAAAATATAATAAAATAAAAPPAAAQPDGVARSCVLAVANKLGQVVMWRLDLPASYSHKQQQQQQPPAEGDGSGNSSSSSGSGVRLHWMGALQVHSGGAHVLRTAWCVAPEGAAGTATAAAGAGAGAEWCQWRVPQPHSAGPRDSIMLLTGVSDGSILLWSAPAASFTRASDMTLLAQLCPPDGLAPTSLDCTWLPLSRVRRGDDGTGLQHGTAAAAAGGAGAGESPAVVSGGETPKQKQQQQRRRSRRLGQQQQQAAEVEVEEQGAAGEANGGAAPMDVDGEANGGDKRTVQQQQQEEEDEEWDDATWASEAPVEGPMGRRLLVAASKPCGAVFVWRSGVWRRPSGCHWEAARVGGVAGTAADGKHGEEQDDGSVTAAGLAAACTTSGGGASCLLPGAHGTHHASGVALAAGRPLVVSGGVDGAVKCWKVSELKLPPSPLAAAPLPPSLRRRPLALVLTEVPDGMHRLDPCSAGLPALSRQVRTLPLSRQAVHGIAASGNGLVFAVLRTTSPRQLDIAKNVMIHGRVLGGTVHLLTPYGMGVESAAAAADAVAAAPLALPPPGQLAAGLLYQAPTASSLWDVHALMLRAGLVAAAATPPPPEDAWEAKDLREATAADDAAALQQLQGG